MNLLPTKLKKEPLIEVVFELRFEATAPASTILPGILFQWLGANAKIERLPFADIPKALVDANPQLRYAPLLRFKVDKYAYLISDLSVAVAADMPYAGWDKFRPVIIKLIDELKKSGIIKSIERYSLKYVDLLEASTLAEQLAFVNLKLLIANRDIKQQHVQLRVELMDGKITHIMQLATKAQFLTSEGRVKSGLAIDVDSFAVFEDQATVDDAWNELDNGLDKLHHENKKMFFDSLSKDTLTNLEPSYD